MNSSNRRSFVIGVIAAIMSLSSFNSVKAQDPGVLHWAAWDSALAAANTDPAQRYAYYAYRTLAVPHPEVYLQADAVFSAIVEKMPGSRMAFRGADVRDMELFRRLLDGKQEGPSFNWRMWVPTSDSIYDPLDPALEPSWLDLRVASAAVILVAPSPQMSTAEAAMMRYTQLRRGGQSDSALFVVIDAEGHGYLAKEGGLIAANSGRAWDGDAASIVPALVFNERFVYYPLFARDDRSKNAELERLAGRLAAPVRPVLSAADSARVMALSSAAALPTRAAQGLALISALGGLGIEHPLVKSVWSDMFGKSDDSPLGCEKGMLRLIFYRANRLSPRTAMLAASAPSAPFDSAAVTWERQYLRWCGRRVNPRDTVKQEYEAGGYLWAFELLELGFDDIIRTRAGAGSSQTLAMAAALDLRGVPNLRVEIDVGDDLQPNQHWILADGGRWQFNFGRWRRVGSITDAATRIPMIVDSYSMGGRWASLITTYLFTDTDHFTVAEDLTQLTVMMPSVDPRLRASKEQTVTFAEFMRQVNEDEVTWHPLPWPPIDGPETRGVSGTQ